MPKVKVISRNESEFTRDRKSDLVKVYRNIDPKLHPFEKPREYVRALNAVKLDKVFAKPFLYALAGHRDGIWSMCTLPTTLVTIASGSCDGEMRIWNLSNRKCIWKAQAHSRFVRGICSDNEGKNMLTCSDDKTIKIWAIDQSEALDNQEEIQPINTFLGKNNFTGIDHHRNQNMFATSGVQVDIWDVSRAEATHSFKWGAESIYTVKFNLIETNVLGATSSDRNVILYDVRQKSPMRKLTLTNNSNALCWNPQEAYHFTIANDDGNAYTFDMRRMKRAQLVHEDHVSAVIAVDYSPTGQEIVTGSYDRTLRIYSTVKDTSHSREIYFTKRMHRIFSVKYSADCKYVLSGSDDTNIRLWKAHASKRIGALLPREKRQEDYCDKLKQKYQYAPEVRRIARHRHLPSFVNAIRMDKHNHAQAERRKTRNKKAHSAPGTVRTQDPKKAKVVGEVQ